MRRRFILLLSLAILATLLHTLLLPSTIGGGYRFVPLYAGSLGEGELQPLFPGPSGAGDPALGGSTPWDPGTLPNPLAVYSEDEIGYVDPTNGAILHRQRPAYGAAVTSWGFANYGAAPSNIVVQRPDGSRAFSIGAPGYPVAAGEAFLFLHADGHVISEYDEEGRELWRYGAISPVTAVDASGDRRVLGFMSGHLYATVVDPESTAPEWVRLRLPASEIPVVYDAAFSPGGTGLVVRSGLEPQRVSYFDFSGDSIDPPRPTWSVELPVQSLRPGSIVADSATELLVGLSGELLRLDRATGTLLGRVADRTLQSSATSRPTGLTLRLLADPEGRRRELSLLDRRGAELYRAPLFEGGVTVAATGGAFILARGETVAILKVGLR